MHKWVDVTDYFSEEERHYNGKYLENSEVLDEKVEASIFSSPTEPYEIYFYFGRMYGIVYTDKNHAYELRKQMQKDLEKEYNKNKEPSSKFVNDFADKYDVCIPYDMFFNEQAFMEGMLKALSMNDDELYDLMEDEDF